MSISPSSDDEVTLIAVRYALGDAIEHLRGVSAGSKPVANVIEDLIGAATELVMTLLSPRETDATRRTPRESELSCTA